jgi:hypothetical protein
VVVQDAPPVRAVNVGDLGVRAGGRSSAALDELRYALSAQAGRAAEQAVGRPGFVAVGERLSQLLARYL